jgi:hypothetical protein
LRVSQIDIQELLLFEAWIDLGLEKLVLTFGFFFLVDLISPQTGSSLMRSSTFGSFLFDVLKRRS